ncbi:MAG: NAD-dependent epimerase/dehydratase family protein [Alteromonadaceae bacterium]|nr:NAD-dependent epimerase/dehydratase family protein [Alteromonadaceae bacterium]
MLVLILGCDELLGCAVTQKMLAKGYTVLGYSLQTTSSSFHKNNLELLQNGHNGHHFSYRGSALEQEWEAERELAKSFEVFFLPCQTMAVRHAQLLLAQTLKLQHLLSQLDVLHLVCASGYQLYYPHHHRNMQANELVAHPQSLSAARLRSMELLLHAMSAQFSTPCTVLRFFELYGDLADENAVVAKLWRQIENEEVIDLSQWRNDVYDFVFINDAAEASVRTIEHPAVRNSEWEFDEESLDSSEFPWRVYNVGTGVGTSLEELLNKIQQATGKQLKTKGNWQKDRLRHVADTEKFTYYIGYKPTTLL